MSRTGRRGRAATPPVAGLHHDPHWLDPAAADALLAALHDGIAWESHRVVLFGRAVAAPRRSCWIGDAGAVYRYSRSLHLPRAWPDVLLPIRARLRAEWAVDCNGVLANLYRDGRDGMGWHADDEPEIDPTAPILSLSLGASRRFVLRRRDDHARRHELELGHGSLLVMGAGMQAEWQHALPATARPLAARINLTFRRVIIAPAQPA